MSKVVFLKDENVDSLKLESALRSIYPPIRLIYVSHHDFIQSCYEEKPDLIILTHSERTASGLDVLRSLKEEYGLRDIPVVFYTNYDNTEFRIMAYKEGALDYILCNKDPVEIATRVLAKIDYLQRQGLNSRIKVGRLWIDTNSHQVFYIDDLGKRVEYSLSLIDLKLLMFFVRNKDLKVSRKEIIDNIWGENVHVTQRTVDVHIASLRKKIPMISEYIKTIYGKGYFFSY